MTKRIAGLTSIVVLALGLTAFAGSALGGNGNGNAAGGPGNSENAPGQLKKDTAPSQSQGGGSADQNSAGVNGIKPTNGTSKGTTCSTGGGTGSSATCSPTSPNAAAASGAGNGDVSKRYGSGTTAAQIANVRGAPAGTPVYGPGNSQPHKVQKCPGSGKWVDVHAVKSYSSASCAAGSQPTTRGKPSSSAVTTAAGVPSKATSPSVAAGVKGAAAAPAAAPAGGVLGVTESAGKSGPAGGVLGAIESVGQGVLPFTGFPLWAAVLVAFALMALGLALRRNARATV